MNVLCEEMGHAYPELLKQKNVVEQVLLREEEQFAQTLSHGMRLLEQDIAELKDSKLSGETVFKLYDTYGFPLDLTADIAREKGLTIDEAEFEHCMNAQRQRSQSSSKFGVDYTKQINLGLTTSFTGYKETFSEVNVVALLKEGKEVNELHESEEGCVILASTPFYAESGGQAGDSGVIKLSHGVVDVIDTKKSGDTFLHLACVIQGKVVLKDKGVAEVNEEQRANTALNHSATHLLHAALRQVLGEHVVQKGSLVDAERLRFDFSHHQAVSRDELNKIEDLVNREIRKNHEVMTKIKTPQEAQAEGAMALFGEKYGDSVRVLSMGDFSKELCGGTHVKRTGDIGLLKIVSEAGIASGVRRIEAVTGEKAFNLMRASEQQLQFMAQQLKIKPEELEDKMAQLQNQMKAAEKQIQQLQLKLAQGGEGQVDAVREVAGIKLFVKQVDGLEIKVLRDMLDQQKNKLGSGVVVLASVMPDDKVQLIAGVTHDLISRVHAGQLVSHLAAFLGGKGGGRADMAQAGGNNSAKLSEALNSIDDWLMK